MTKPGNSGTVLYIEDTPDNRMLVKRVIESIGVTCYEAGSGLEGIQKTKDLRPDLVLLDINLPDISGYEVARRLRSSGDPHMVYVPIIAITANALRGDSEKVLESGCDVYMTKPVNIRELIARIAAFMEVINGPEWNNTHEWSLDQEW